MGTVLRHSNSPYVAGETLAAADLELDIANLVSEVNGGLDDGNIADSADINGTKLLDSSVTTGKLATGAVTKGYVSTATAEAAMTTSATLVDIPGITDATMTAGSTDDYIFMDLTISANRDAGGSSAQTFAFGFEVNGTPYDLVTRTVLDPIATVHTSFAVQAPAAGTGMIIKPQYRKFTGSEACTFYDGVQRVFRVLIVPTK